MNALALPFLLPLEVPFLPRADSTLAHRTDMILLALVIFSVLFTFSVAGAILYFSVKYRAGRGEPRPAPVRNQMRYELTWIIIPTLMTLVLFVWAAKEYLYRSRPPADAITVYVVAKQWMWKFQHVSGQREINELHIPAGRPIKLVMISQDVIHSLFVPEFRMKQDVLPDRYTTQWFQALRPGIEHLFCTQYCGTGHSDMRGTIIVMDPAEYQQWLGPSGQGAIPGSPGTPGAPMAVAMQVSPSMAARGQATFQRLGCVTCHLPSSSLRAPRLDGIFGREVRLRNNQNLIADEFYIRESILNPNAKIVAGYPNPSDMPSYQGQVNEEEILELIEFVRSLRHGWPESTGS